MGPKAQQPDRQHQPRHRQRGVTQPAAPLGVKLKERQPEAHQRQAGAHVGEQSALIGQPGPLQGQPVREGEWVGGGGVAA